MGMPTAAVPREISDGTDPFTIEDLHNIVRYANLPDKDSLDDELQCWATSSDLEMAIMEPGNDALLYEFMNKGGLYSKGALNLFFYRKPDKQLQHGIDRGHLFHLAGSIRRLFEQPVDDSYDALVGIEYGDDVNPINGSITCQRHYEQVSFDDILHKTLSNLSGVIENVRFTGVVEARTDVKYSNMDATLARPPGLCIPVVLGVFAGSGRDEQWEPLGDRATRMLHQCSEARSLTAARNVIAMLNKPKLINEFKAAPKSFPRLRLQDLTKNVDKLKSSLRNQVQEVDKIAAVCSLFETALSMFADDDLDKYCATHFLIRGINRHVMEHFVSLAHKTLDEHGRLILSNCRPTLQNVLPFAVAETLTKCVDGMLPSGRWRFISSKCLGADRLCMQLVPVDGFDEVEMIKFKRTSIRPLMSNLGFVVMDGTREVALSTLGPKQALPALNVVWGSRLTADQSKIRDLARKMCFKTAVAPFPLSPSVTPDFANGAIIFVNPAITRDLPEMVTECEQRGIRIGVGVMFCNKSLTELVMRVIDTKRIMGAKGDVQKTTCKHTAFSKVESRVVLELPTNPSLSTRRLVADSIRSQAAPNFVSDPGPAPGTSELGSLQSRPTRTTGDLPRDSIIEQGDTGFGSLVSTALDRPNECDVQHRQPLRGHVHGGRFYNKREARVNAQLPTQHEEWHAPHAQSSWQGIAHGSGSSSANNAASSSQSQGSHWNHSSKGKGGGRRGRASSSNSWWTSQSWRGEADKTIFRNS